MPSCRFASAAALRVGAVMFAAVAVSPSAQLKQETVSAWDSYITQQSARIQQQAGQQQGFFWADAVPDRFNQIRGGAVLVSPFSEPNPLRVPGGLIHHWIGAAFLPKASIKEVLAITRDYANFKVYYKPGVADAAATLKSEYKDEFAIRFVSTSVLTQTSLLGNYETIFSKVNEKRWYTTSETTQMCEIRNFGRPNEKRFSSTQGSGYIWRLYSSARMEERDGGVLVEIEAIALSRDIPDALRWFIVPIVNRLSRESLETSLMQTAKAVHEHTQAGDTRIIEAGTQHADNSSVRP